MENNKFVKIGGEKTGCVNFDIVIRDVVSRLNEEEEKTKKLENIIEDVISRINEEMFRLHVERLELEIDLLEKEIELIEWKKSRIRDEIDIYCERVRNIIKKREGKK